MFHLLTENHRSMMALINSGTGVRHLESCKDSGSVLCKQLAEKKLMPPFATYPGLGEATQSLKEPTLDVDLQFINKGLGR